MRMEGFEEDHFGRLRGGSVSLGGATKAFGGTHVHPVCRLVHGSLEVLGIYEGL